MSNEITVKLNDSIEEVKKLLEQKGFTVNRKFTVADTFFIPKDLKVKNSVPREILKKAVLLRHIIDFEPYRDIKKFTFKKKDINEKGEILNQEKIECTIFDIQEGKNFIKSIGFMELMKIKENDVKYKRGNLEIILKDVENGDNMIEVELVENDVELNTIDKVKDKVAELELPIDTNDYFVKKAEIELNKILE